MLPLFLAADVALDRPRVDVPFGNFVVPLLVSRTPDLPLSTTSTGKRPVEVVLRQGAVGIDVRQFRVVSGHGRGMAPLLVGVEPGDPLSLRELCRAGITSRIAFAAHAGFS